MSEALTRCWYGRSPLRWVLAPFSLLFFLIVALRRLAYRMGLLRAQRLPVPVIVVGNLTAGGAGKTPLTLLLARWLKAAGYQPGVVSRGYGGAARDPLPVHPDSDPAQVGDEPLLLARRADCPVWIGRKRAKAARRLLALHPEVDVILSDDGLQHYALARDLELAVVDGARGFGNGWLLPAGPLREPVARLGRVTALVLNGAASVALDLPAGVPVFAMHLAGRRFVNLRHPQRQAEAEAFRGQPLHAVAGIGHPQRFFQHLAGLGLDVVGHPYPDHHVFQPADLPAGRVVMTEKDAVKCAAFAHDEVWYLPVDAEVDAGLKTLMLDTLKNPHGSQTA